MTDDTDPTTLAPTDGKTELTSFVDPNNWIMTIGPHTYFMDDGNLEIDEVMFDPEDCDETYALAVALACQLNRLIGE